MRFDQYNLPEVLKRSLAELGFTRPTDIQYKAIPHILAGEDVLAIAQTGTGKTAAFAIPILQRLVKAKNYRRKSTRCLVFVPTRELAIQIHGVFKELGKYSRLTFFCLYGGVEQLKQIEKLETGIDILITTPGRMFDLHHQGYVDLSDVEVFVIDEADKMLDAAFIKDITDIQKLLPYKHQTLFFSATIDKDIKKLAYSVVRNPIRIDISPEDPVSKNIDHAVMFVEMDDKRAFLERWVKQYPDKKILVFVRTQVRAERVMKAMERVEIQSLVIHGGKEQAERIEALREFSKGTVKVMIATDVSARGIDIPDVQYVINYDLPEVAENYVHRIGRTGRGTKRGYALSFCSKEEMPLLEGIEKYIGKSVSRMQISNGEYQETLMLSEDTGDWRILLKQMQEEEENTKRPQKVVKKKKK